MWQDWKRVGCGGCLGGGSLSSSEISLPFDRYVFCSILCSLRVLHSILHLKGLLFKQNLEASEVSVQGPILGYVDEPHPKLFG